MRHLKAYMASIGSHEKIQAPRVGKLDIPQAYHKKIASTSSMAHRFNCLIYYKKLNFQELISSTPHSQQVAYINKVFHFQKHY